MKRRFLSALLALCMLLTLAPTAFATGTTSTNTVTAAPLHDRADTPVSGDLCTDYKAELTEQTVKITAKDLVKHTSGNDVEGYWVGFSVVPPADAGVTHMKYALGNGSFSAVTPLEGYVDGTNSGVAFYFDAAKKSTYQGYQVQVQWCSNETGTNIGTATTYTVDLSDVFLAYDPAANIGAAPLRDTSSGDQINPTDYAAALDGQTVKITAKDLVKHTNGKGVEGYWVGFYLTAPEGANGFKYAKGNTIPADTKTESLEGNVDGEGATGMAYYVDAADANAQKTVTVQWYQGGHALTEAYTFTVDTGSVDTNTEGGDSGDDNTNTDDGDSGDDNTDTDNGDSGDDSTNTEGGDSGDDNTNTDNGDSGDDNTDTDNGDSDDGSTEETPAAPVSYKVSVSKDKNGSASVSDKTAYAGDTITIKVDPDRDYELDVLTVTTETGSKLPLTKKSDTRYTFKMPAGNVTVKVRFALEEVAPMTHFRDVSGSDVETAITYVCGRGLMVGIGSQGFSPNTQLSSAEFVSILYREAGSPILAGKNAFADAAKNSACTDALAWANVYGLTAGFDAGSFGVNVSITREQLARILMNYAAVSGRDVSGRASLSGYRDAASISPWQTEAVQWAVAKGILDGRTSNTLAATSYVTRGEVAVALMNYFQNVVGY